MYNSVRIIGYFLNLHVKNHHIRTIIWRPQGITKAICHLEILLGSTIFAKPQLIPGVSPGGYM